MVLNVHINLRPKAYLGREKGGGCRGYAGGGGGGGEGDYIPIATLSLPESVSDSCIKMGSNERHLNVSLIGE